MDCPKCDGTLQPTQVADLRVESCSKCSGLWLRYGQLKPLLSAWAKGQAIKESHTIMTPPQANGRYGYNPDQIIGPCPYCPTRTLMIPITRDIGAAVRVDYCQRGHGLWLDIAEIRQIRSRLFHKEQAACEQMLQQLLPNSQAA